MSRTITARVEWIDDDICRTIVSGSHALNLSEVLAEGLCTWALAIEVGCSDDELIEQGWESNPAGVEATDNGWALDWNVAHEA